MAWATICRKKHQSHSPTPRPSSLAEAIADLDYVLSIIVEHSTEFLPGEAVDEIKSAWSEAEFEFAKLAIDLAREGSSFPQRGG